MNDHDLDALGRRAAAEVRAVSDLVHALHAATGVGVPTNEEWHHRVYAERDLAVLEAGD